MNLIQTDRSRGDRRSSADQEPIPEFRPGDTLRVGVQASSKASAPASRTTKACASRARTRAWAAPSPSARFSFGEGVERVFPLYSPNIDSIEVVRHGVVRRAKLYYLRGRSGKSARIAERRDPRPAKEAAE